MITLDSRPVPVRTVQGRQLEDEAVLVLPEKGEVKVLNTVGARIWSLADGSRSVRDIAAALCAEYSISTAQAEADTLDFIQQLVAKGIVTIRSA